MRNDDSAAERVFSSPEAGRLDGRRFASRAEAGTAGCGATQAWQGPVRLHPGIRDPSSMTFETDMRAAMTTAWPSTHATLHQTGAIPHPGQRHRTRDRRRRHHHREAAPGRPADPPGQAGS